jgi:hypothetical protein
VRQMIGRGRGKSITNHPILDREGLSPLNCIRERVYQRPRTRFSPARGLAPPWLSLDRAPTAGVVVGRWRWQKLFNAVELSILW